MPDFNVKDIENLKFKLQIIEKCFLGGLIFVVLGFYYDWDPYTGLVVGALIIIQIMKSRLRKKLRQKEYLAKIVEERTIELRVQRDQVLQESEKLSTALDALAKAQDELVRKEKLASVGQLTKGLVDRILNPINYINNFATLSVELIKDVKKNIDDQEAVMTKEIYADSVDILEMISSNLQKITEHGCNTVRIVKAMEELLRDRHGNTTPTDICNLCKVNIDVINKSFEEEIEEKKIQIHFESLPAPLLADINIEQMNKVLVSLMKNSMHALLRKAGKTDYEPKLTVRLEKQYDTFTIRIHDNGIGIEDSIKEKIFEPFFTTKSTAEAAGVGLYLSREVILNHKGTILVKSEKDNFTEFEITLPIHQSPHNNGRV